MELVNERVAILDNRPIFVLPGGNSALSHRKELRTIELFHSPIWIGSVCGDVAWLPSARESPPPITRWLMSLVCAVLENRSTISGIKGLKRALCWIQVLQEAHFSAVDGLIASELW
ncbi:hypothetical protein D8B26_001892 [Coccidioides posadasii str. Silveira]|uniref:uncharacterized protein n=1 Tax=Coccidioides posadasii (strain RMSCC 757 / Silveira) TaxID=443226 RepID=UPI001BF12FB6|nr:hypothetical protein D8B26_001892 [Coccidioides posadasii str. Silveira]